VDLGHALLALGAICVPLLLAWKLLGRPESPRRTPNRSDGRDAHDAHDNGDRHDR
jgi:hypothetical protein